MTTFSPLQKQRQNFQPKLPRILQNLIKLKASLVEGKMAPNDELAPLFPKTLGQQKCKFILSDEKENQPCPLGQGNDLSGRGLDPSHPNFEKTPPLREGSPNASPRREDQPLRVGVVLSGGQAAGGHNVITGLFDALKKLHPDSRLFGFLNGPQGIVDNTQIELTKEVLAPYRNQGGFDMIGAGRTKIETPEQFQGAANTSKNLQLNGLVIIGGDDSNTNAALLAEYFETHGIATRVIGVPKTIDGDLKNEEIEISFGFDTATKTFSEIIGNILRDSLSAKKYYFFIKLMGRSASHIALECALQTHPNFTFIGEEVAAKRHTLKDLTNQLCDLICKRADDGKNYGVILIPEGIVEFIPEVKDLIQELNRMIIDTQQPRDERIASARKQLSAKASQCFDSIPESIQAQLLLDRDPHGNVQVSKIETERLFIQAVKKELKRREKSGSYSGKFSSQPLFCGYEGRSCLPSNFDAQYCYALGQVTALLINEGCTGYMSCIKNLAGPVEGWDIAGIPLTSMIHMEERKAKMKPVIRKALVDLQGKPFTAFHEQREHWSMNDDYLYPGPIQYFGPTEITDAITLTLANESKAPAFFSC